MTFWRGDLAVGESLAGMWSVELLEALGLCMPIQTEHLLILATLALAIAGLILSARRLSEVFRDLFGGGPRPPTHPLAADDTAFLTRRSRRRATD